MNIEDGQPEGKKGLIEPPQVSKSLADMLERHSFWVPNTSFPDNKIPRSIGVNGWLNSRYGHASTFYDIEIPSLYTGLLEKNGNCILCSIRIQPKQGTEIDSLGARGTNLFDNVFYSQNIGELQKLLKQ